MKFYQCDICKKIIVILDDSKVDTICCNQPMKVISPHIEEVGGELHMPEVKCDKDTVKVRISSLEHPHTKSHHIKFILLEYEDGFDIKYLDVEKSPICEFNLRKNSRLMNVYSNCNIHGLWKRTINDCNTKEKCNNKTSK